MANTNIKLRFALPLAGFRWPEGHRLTDRLNADDRRDESIIKALYRRGGCPSLAPGPKNTAALAEVSAALSALCVLARAVLVAHPEKETFEATSAARLRLPWDMTVHEQTVIELFLELYQARGHWYQDPQEPFDVAEHGALAHAIDQFHAATGGGNHWVLPEVEVLELAGGFVHDDEGDEEEDEDGEVREVRKHLAKTSLGKEEEDDDEEMNLDE